MHPTDYKITTIWVVPVLGEVATSIFKLNTHMLPFGARCIQCPLAFAIWEIGSDALDEETKFPAYHAKEVNNSLLVDWCIP